ncbi:hypothetical protein CY35_18G070300 [Sphagnum magellanicum]|nr:hypothetical protein CY35_18G070300 [Sphagnum magellanicum]KAH9533777.1 hypothetical protein CY35_18G070300 [Sphagnum magellanicum]
MIHDLCHCASNNNQESRASSSGEDETIIMSIYPEDLLESSQQEALSRFRLLLTQEGLIRKRDDDNSLLRFLRARAFNIAKAKAMFEAMLEWRKEIGADTIKETFQFPEREAIKELYPHFHHKTDKMGRPVYIERLGQLQVDELLKITTMDRMLLYHVKEWEILIDRKIPACSNKAGTCISQTLTILDMKGVTMRHMSKQVRNFIQKITKVDQDFYPEYLGKMFIVNAPTAFKAMWAVVRPWLDKRTQKKIEVHGGNFSSKLLELVDSENLPAFLGGSCCCPGGCENADAGPWNERIYQQKQVYDESSKAMD